VPERYSSVLGVKKTIFGRRNGLPNFTFLFLVERLPKKIFSAKGYAEIHIQRPFFDNKNSI
jgi:hypothetical protein